MTTTTLTPKQKRVYDLALTGAHPAEIAKKLHITSSGVYGHLRRIREAGFEIANGEQAAHSNGAAAESDAPERPLTLDELFDGTPVEVDMPTILRAQIAFVENQRAQNASTKEQLQAQQDVLDAQDRELAALLDIHREALRIYTGADVR